MSRTSAQELLRAARMLGFELSESEIEEIREQAEHGLAAIERLDELRLAEIEPALGVSLNDTEG